LSEVNEKLKQSLEELSDQQTLVSQILENPTSKQQNHGILVHYLPKIMERGPNDGSAPLQVAIPLRSVGLL